MKTPKFTPAEAAQIEQGLQGDRMSPQAIDYALAKQVPDMARGFSICTSYGAIGIPPGRMADTLARAVTRALQCELLHQERRRHHAHPTEAEHGHA